MVPPMKQRYCYGLYPHPHQQVALAKALGCARVVYNHALAKSHKLYEEGQKVKGSEPMRLCITPAKQTPERSWLAGPSNVVLQTTSICDLDQAFRYWWSRLRVNRKGPRVRAPQFKRRAGRQAIRFMSHVLRPEEGAVVQR